MGSLVRCHQWAHHENKRWLFCVSNVARVRWISLSHFHKCPTNDHDIVGFLSSFLAPQGGCLSCRLLFVCNYFYTIVFWSALSLFLLLWDEGDEGFLTRSAQRIHFESCIYCIFSSDRILDSLLFISPWSTILDKFIIAWLLNSPLYGTQRFITVFIKPRHWSLSWEARVYVFHTHPVSSVSILILYSPIYPYAFQGFTTTYAYSDGLRIGRCSIPGRGMRSSSQYPDQLLGPLNLLSSGLLGSFLEGKQAGV